MKPEQKVKLFEQTLKTLFPGLDVAAIKYGNDESGKESWNYFHYNIPPSNALLLHSPYYYKKKSIVHFTSIAALASILRDRALRLYNLHTLNDPREFTFASRIFNLNRELINDAKDNLFIMSFCEREILKKNPVEFNLWRLYGHLGRGINIIFSVKNNPEYWVDFHLSKVIYGSVNRKNFKELALLLEELNSDKPTIEIDFGKLYAFHKSILFEPEQEVRLLFDARRKRAGIGNRTVSNKGKQIFPIIKTDLLKLIDAKDKVRYLQIPIDFSGNNSLELETPLLRIESIHIGYIFGDEGQKIIKSLRELCNEFIGYEPEIEQTRLRKFYWDAKNP